MIASLVLWTTTVLLFLELREMAEVDKKLCILSSYEEYCISIDPKGQLTDSNQNTSLDDGGMDYGLTTNFYHKSQGIQLASSIKSLEESKSELPRIVGGSTANLGEYPHFGGLIISLIDGSTSVCGSSLLTNTRAVTAAHCWWDGVDQGDSLEAVFGSIRLFSGGTRITTSNVTLHKSWNPKTVRNDIAIINLSYVGYNDFIKNIALAHGKTKFEGAQGWICGFGLSSDSSSQITRLNKLSLRVTTNAKCKEAFGSAVTAAMLCTTAVRGQGTCSGDSGGPLETIYRGQRVLIGISSFVAIEGCEKELPNGFTRISYYHSWITSHL